MKHLSSILQIILNERLGLVTVPFATTQRFCQPMNDSDRYELTLKLIHSVT